MGERQCSIRENSKKKEKQHEILQNTNNNMKKPHRINRLPHSSFRKYFIELNWKVPRTKKKYPGAYFAYFSFLAFFVVVANLHIWNWMQQKDLNHLHEIMQLKLHSIYIQMKLFEYIHTMSISFAFFHSPHSLFTFRLYMECANSLHCVVFFVHISNIFLMTGAD